MVIPRSEAWLAHRRSQSAKVFIHAKAGIHKDASVHSLCHSFATHLSETGTDLRYIQELLGYRSSKKLPSFTRISQVRFEEDSESARSSCVEVALVVGKTIFTKFVEPPNEAESAKFGENKLSESLKGIIRYD